MIIWLASYPRCGNTYLRVALKHAFGLETYSIYDDKHDIGDHPATAKVVGHKERPGDFSLDTARQSDKAFLIKTHEIVSNDLDKVIYILRDGRAAVVSYFHYLNSYSPRKYSLSDVLVGAVPYGGWGKHLESWNPENRKNTLVLRFEDLTSSPNRSVEEISNFLHMERRQSNIPGFEELRSINPTFFRKGNADSWQEDLQGDELFAFWFLNFPQMSRYYPIVNPPSIAERSEFSTLENYFLQGGSAIRSVINDLLDAKAREIQLASGLQQELQIAKNSLSDIKTAVADLTGVRAFREPARKYELYKHLITTINSK